MVKCICEECKKEFEARYNHRFCSYQCAMKSQKREVDNIKYNIKEKD